MAGVVLFHAGYLTGGYLGVDAFFVLSGFLITSLLLAETRTTATIRLRNFWVRRARRLLPALVLVLLAVAAYAWLFARPDELQSIRLDCWATLAYVANWRQIASSNDYFALFRSPSPLQHTWSLAIEEQFYLVWPLVVLVAVRGVSFARAARRVFTVSLTLACTSLVLAQVLYRPNDASRVYYGTDTRAGAILLGAALGAWYAARSSRGARAEVASMRLRVLGATSSGAALGLAVAWARLSGDSKVLYRGGLAACSIATVLVIAACVEHPRGLVARVLSWRPLRGLGLISYGVYLWHWPLFVVLTTDRTHLDGPALLFVRCSTTLAAALLSYRFVERPIRSGAGARTWMIRLVPVTAVVLVVAIIAATAGVPPAQSATKPPTSGGVLVVGDSVGINLGLALDRAGLGVSVRSVFGCSLVSGVLNIRGGTAAKSCGPWAEWVTAQRPDFVLLTVRGVAGGATTVTVHGATIPVTTSRYATLYRDALERAIDALAATGAIVIVLNAPCMQPADVPQAQWPRFADQLVAENALLHDVATRPQNRRRVITPDFRGFLCPHGRFQRSLGTVSDARPDGVHFSPAGADVAARWLLQQVPALSHTRRTHRTLADDLFYRLTAGGFVCTFGSAGTAADRHFATNAACAYPWLPHHATATGSLHVDRRPEQLASYAATYREAACAAVKQLAVRSPSRVRVAYIAQPDWVFSGTAAAVAVAAKVLDVPVTYFTC